MLKIKQFPYIKSEVLAKEFGVSPSTIKKYRRDNGIDTRFKIPLSDKKEFIENYKIFQSQEKMADYYGVDRHTIKNYCEQINFDDSIYKVHKLTSVEQSEIIELYNNTDFSYQKISELVSVPITSIDSVVHRFNLSKNKDKTVIRRKYSISNENYFENIDSHNKAYWLGFIGADGCISYRNKGECHNILKISLQSSDDYILECLKKELGTSKPLCYCRSNGREYVTLEISSNKIVQDLENLGLHERKTYGNSIANIPNEYMIDLIRGYIDGDGTIGDNKLVSIAGFENNMIKLQQYLTSINILTSYFCDERLKYNIEKATSNSFGNLSTTNKMQSYCLLKAIYLNKNNCYLIRKYEKAKNIIQNIENSEEIRDKQIIIYYKNAVQRLI